jgi:hypothetical protein
LLCLTFCFWFLKQRKTKSKAKTKGSRERCYYSDEVGIVREVLLPAWRAKAALILHFVFQPTQVPLSELEVAAVEGCYSSAEEVLTLR